MDLMDKVIFDLDNENEVYEMGLERPEVDATNYEPLSEAIQLTNGALNSIAQVFGLRPYADELGRILSSMLDGRAEYEIDEGKRRRAG